MDSVERFRRPLGTDADYPTDGDFNESTVHEERMLAILKRHKEQQGTTDVSLLFWVSCHIACLDGLEKNLLKQSFVAFERDPYLFEYWARGLYTDSDTHKLPLPLATGAVATAALDRDNAVCILTGTAFPVAAPIFPPALLSTSPTAATARQNLAAYLTHIATPKTTHWENLLFYISNMTPAQREALTLRNVLCLSLTAHQFYRLGLFALKPLPLLSTENPATTLRLQFFWQTPVKLEDEDPVLYTTGTTPSTRNLEKYGCLDAMVLFRNDKGVRIRSGDVFILETTDPVARPLPGRDLVEVQWVLNRVVGMMGNLRGTGVGMVENEDGEGSQEYVLGRESRIVPRKRTWRERRGM